MLDGWIQFTGVDCPVLDDTRVDVQFANGQEDYDSAAGTWSWSEEGEHAIVAYRLAKVTE